MQKFDDRDGKKVLETWRGSLLMLGFGMALLAFLIAIDRPQWFILRPVSGTAAAMAKAAAPAPSHDIAAVRSDDRHGAN